MNLKFTSFRSFLEEGNIAKVYIFSGEDAFFRDRGLSLLKEKFVTEPTLDVSVFDGNADISDVIASFLSYPFISEKRITAIKEFYPNKEGTKKLLSSVSDIPERGILAVFNSKKTENFAGIKDAVFIDCDKADAGVLVKWVVADCKRNNIEIQPSSANLLIEYCLSDMARINVETQKLMSFVGDGGEITSSLVKEQVSRSTEYKIYEMTGCVAKKDFNGALDIVSDMFSKGETPQRLISSIYNYYRKLLHVAISNLSISELSSILSTSEGAIRRMKNQTAFFKKKALKKAVDILTDADYKIKDGEADGTEMFWLSLFKIMTEE